MNGLMLHVGGVEASLAALRGFPAPAATPTYEPIAHADLVEEAAKRIGRVLGGEPDRVSIGTNKAGAHAFAAMTWGVEGVSGITVGLRSSYDRAFAVGVAAGRRVFVCDNLAFAGERTIHARHVKGAWQDVREGLDAIALEAVPAARKMEDEFARLVDVRLADDEAFALLGVAHGRGLLPARQFGVALDRWREPTHREFLREDGTRTAWTLHNAMTEALKSTPAEEVLGRTERLHAFVVAAAAEA